MTRAQSEFDGAAEHLSALDAAIGDGDHGSNMQRGFRAVVAAFGDADVDRRPGPLLMLGGATLMDTIGGASGALWGFGLRRAGRELGVDATFDLMRLAALVTAMTDAVVELGEAELGDKTMLDALAPAAAVLERHALAKSPELAACRAAATAAHDGAVATIEMQARRGRASFLGARSIGHQDPSATSVALFFRALEAAIGDRQ